MDHDEYHLVERAFIDGFRGAPDKQAFLKLSRIPLEVEGEGLKLVEVRIEDTHTVGTASPGFGAPELVYHPLPAEMVVTSTGLSFVYVSMKERREMSLADLLALRGESIDQGTDHHPHHAH
ncbi:hypothetical protein [Magnetospira sp. QH-2]|uniref:hypothetical protein n=1 Tax=Magnetospira sp. (strain QH-2) TaxID=1288970 RepID=UPI0003E80C48|nr:hypothetical protein [Magnetospira sp. QH-2]CCQ74551.1 conserved protein of unknown function [Magnetospira sp. QH-2]